MNSKQIINSLLEYAPGLSEIEVDRVLAILLAVFHVLEKGDSGFVYADVFEKEANQALADAGYNVEVTSKDPVLNKHHALARAGIDGVKLLMPYRTVTRDDILHMRKSISHEFVHVDQLNRSIGTGSGTKMLSSAYKRMGYPKSVDKNKYFTDRHELAAWARTAVDELRDRGLSKEAILKRLRRGPVRHPAMVTLDPEAKRRFIQQCVRYAQNLPN